MVQTFKGYFSEDGRFVPDGVLVKLPIRRRAVVNVFDEEVISDNEDAQDDITIAMRDRAERIRLILAAALSAEDDIMTDNDWNEMLYLRSQTNTGLSRAVDL